MYEQLEVYRGYQSISACDSSAWRKWLQDNGQLATGVFLVLYKKEAKLPSITYDQAVNDALCYGWIDSKINKRDHESWYQYFAPRNPKSNWSKVNKLKIELLASQNLIQPPGYELISYAKANGQWNALNEVDDLVVPKDMQALFDTESTAFGNWQAFSPSSQRGILEWIFNAKTAATREKRIAETVKLAAKNIKANQYVKK